jgi:hypothetical protein
MALSDETLPLGPRAERTGALTILQNAGRGDISAKQLRRFHERITTPTKHWKISAEDIRNRAHRRDYLAALDDVFTLTSTAAAPWYVVPAEYKWFTRVAMAKTVVKALGKGIALGPPALDPAIAKAAAQMLGNKEIAALGLAEPGRARDRVAGA